MNIYTRMLGGLGNQFFIFVYANYIAEHCDDPKIYLDLRDYNHLNIRSFELGRLVDNKRIFLCDDTHKPGIYGNGTRRVYYKVRQFFFRRKWSIDVFAPLLSKFGLYYTRRNAPVVKGKIHRRNVYLYGYFQDFDYMRGYKCDLYKLLRIDQYVTDKVTEFMKTVDVEHTLIVSLRCSDEYVQSGFPICPKEYFERAYEYMTQKHEITRVIGFADDTQVAREKYIDFPCEWVEDMTSYEEIALRAQFKYYILPNSSFAWWSAVLSEHADKHAVLPENWFPNMKTADTHMLFDGAEIL